MISIIVKNIIADHIQKSKHKSKIFYSKHQMNFSHSDLA